MTELSVPEAVQPNLEAHFPEQRPRKWNLQDTPVPSRSDKLSLRVWTCADGSGVQVPRENVDLSVFVADYTPEEYSAHLQHADWTKDETDELFDLCRRFDRRFIVVADRLESGRPRLLEDIKERFYDVTAKITNIRNPTAQTPFTYDKQRDIERRRNLSTLYDRTSEQIGEEELLVHELRRRELAEPQMLAERDYLVKILSRHELPTPMTLPPIPGIGAGAVGETKKRKRPAAVDPQNPDQKKKFAATPVPQPDTPAAHALARREIPQGVYLRGHRLLVPKASGMHQRFKDTLEEYGLSAPPSMPNVAVCDVVDEVRLNVMVLIDIRRSCEKMEAEIIQLREHKRALLAGNAAEAAGGGAHLGKSASASMLRGGDSDDGDEYGEVDAVKRRRKSNLGVPKKARFH